MKTIQMTYDYIVNDYYSKEESKLNFVNNHRLAFLHTFQCFMQHGFVNEEFTRSHNASTLKVEN